MPSAVAIFGDMESAYQHETFGVHLIDKRSLSLEDSAEEPLALLRFKLATHDIGHNPKSRHSIPGFAILIVNGKVSTLVQVESIISPGQPHEQSIDAVHDRGHSPVTLVSAVFKM
jgi:hypothetical protein